MLKTEDLLLTSGDVEISAAGKTPTVTIIRRPDEVPGWGHIVIDLSGLDLTSPQVSILADHDCTLKGELRIIHFGGLDGVLVRCLREPSNANSAKSNAAKTWNLRFHPNGQLRLSEEWRKRSIAL